jgi:Na+/H+ antiporter NhaC
MSDLIVVTILAGGLLEMVRLNGGIDYMISAVVSRVRSRRGAESAICGLTAFANVCTANNTIAILTVGGISRDISREYKISPRRAASLMDTTSCFVQGMIPYGAQLLLASGIVSEELPGHPPVSPLEIIPYLYYPMAVGVMILLSIFIKRAHK